MFQIIFFFSKQSRRRGLYYAADRPARIFLEPENFRVDGVDVPALRVLVTMLLIRFDKISTFFFLSLLPPACIVIFNLYLFYRTTKNFNDKNNKKKHTKILTVLTTIIAYRLRHGGGRLNGFLNKRSTIMKPIFRHKKQKKIYTKTRALVFIVRTVRFFFFVKLERRLKHPTQRYNFFEFFFFGLVAKISFFKFYRQQSSGSRF